MQKHLEVSDPESCFNRAKDTEIIFVLLSRDAAAPAAIRAWVRERTRSGKNQLLDPQIQEALQCAKRMEKQRHERDAKNHDQTAEEETLP